MPLVRLQVKNVYGLGQPELHRNVDRDDTKAILDGVAVSGLVGILRQLGDLTQFATEIFNGIQEEVMITSSRSNKLKMRLKEIEARVPSIQKAVLAQTNHLHFAYTGGLEWHPRIQNAQNQFIYDELPQFIMAPYDDCRDPPRLHLLDKFDINGPGSCLKRYSDPTHFKRASKASKPPEIKKKKSLPRSRDIANVASIANQSDRKTFASLSFGGRTSSSKAASVIETESRSDLQDPRSCSFDSRISVETKPKGVIISSRFTSGSRTIASVLSETESEEDGNDCPSQDLTAHGSSSVSWHEKGEIVECPTYETPEVITETNFAVDAETVSRAIVAVQDIKPGVIEIETEDESDSEGEEDDFVDALYTIESESENDQGALQITEEAQQQKKVSNEISEERLLDQKVCKKISNNYSDDDEETISPSDHISDATHSYYSNGFSNPLYDVCGIQEHQETETESTKTWSNGSLLGLKPSKPKIAAASTIPENDEEEEEEESEDHLSPFDWFASSPPLDHMKISFNPSETSELKLKLPEHDYTFSSFQLMPETTKNTFHDSDSDFCRSSSDNSENRSVSVSEQQWEEEEEDSGEIGESTSQQESYAQTFTAPANGYYSVGNLSYLENPAEPLPPPLPPLEWMVSKTPSTRFEEDDNKKSIKETLTRIFEQNTVKKKEANIVTASSDPKGEEDKVHQKKNNHNLKQSHGNAKENEAGDFLHQIRTKQFNLRHVVMGRTSSATSEATVNNNISVILEKANSIRQAVASGDGDGESDSWSDSDNSHA